MPRAPVIAAPSVRMKPADIDRMLAPGAQKVIARLRSICGVLPEAAEGRQMGSVVWRAGKRSFFMLHDYGKGLQAQFWVGIERQGPLEMDPRFAIPPYLGHQGWISLAADRASARELRDYALESYRHFASRRALASLK